MKFDINKVICINLNAHNEQQLKSISEVYKIDFESLIKLKITASKVWAESGGDWLIAFVNKCDDYNRVIIADKFCPITKREKESLLNIKPIKTPKMPKNVNIILDVDVILEKISASGIKSLSKEELNFLDNIPKK